MKLRLLFGILFLSSVLTLKAEDSNSIFGKWQYHDIYEKEKLDSTGVKMLEMMFKDMMLQFNKDGKYEGLIMGMKDEGTWSFNEKEMKLTLTSTKGKTETVDVVDLSEKTLTIRIGNGVFILNKQVE